MNLIEMPCYDLKSVTQTGYSKNIAELNSSEVSCNSLPFYRPFVYHEINCQGYYSYYCNACYCSQSSIESNLVHLETAVLSQVPVSFSLLATRAKIHYKSFSVFIKTSVHIYYYCFVIAFVSFRSFQFFRPVLHQSLVLIT